MWSDTHIALEPPPSRLIAAHACSFSDMNDANCGSVKPGMPVRRPSATTRQTVFLSWGSATAVGGCVARVNGALPGKLFNGLQLAIRAGQPETVASIQGSGLSSRL